MHPRALALGTLVLLAVTAAGCGSNAGPTISDPKEILTRAVTAMQSATTVHVAATVDGTLSPGILGGGQTGDIALAGTTLNGDVDLAAGNLHATASIPAMLGLTADIIIVGPDTYTKLSLGGDKYTKSTTATGTPGDPAKVITQVQYFLGRPDLDAMKKDDATCGTKACYVVQIAMTPAELGTLLSGLDLGDATVTFQVEVEKDTLRPAFLNVGAKGTTVGDLSLKVALSAWDATVVIAAPPAGEIE